MQLRRQPEAIEVELIRSIFENFLPSVVMTLAFILSGCLILQQHHDPVLFSLMLVALVISPIRLGIAWMTARQARAPGISYAELMRLEWLYGVSYFAFALVVGVFSARAMFLPDQNVHLLIVCLVMGYCGGAAICVGLRPAIVIPCMMVALIPPAVAATYRIDPLYWVLSAMLVAFLAAGISGLQKRYVRAVRNASRRLTFAAMARNDGLTELPNRLGLREWYEENVIYNGTAGIVAVHCLDLNGFKPVNDSYGHSVGDALLSAVSKRLLRLLDSKGVAARLGGDEFVVLQTELAHAGDADVLASQLRDAIARPYRIGEWHIRISTSIGYVVASAGDSDLEELITYADQALYMSKRNDKGITQYDPANAANYPPIRLSMAF